MNNADRMRDGWLALRCQAGDPGAFSLLVSAMERPLLYYTSRLVGGEDRGLDVLQEVWIKAQQRRRGLQTPPSR